MDNFFAKIGQVITDSGTENFMAGIHSLINDYVPVDVTEASNWILDDRNKTVTAVQRLGSWGADNNLNGIGRSVSMGRDEAPDSSIFGKIVNAEDSQLIHLRPRAVPGEAEDSGDRVCQCILLYHEENRRHVISLYRSSRRSLDFTLQELSALKQLSDTILPAVGHHARKKTQKPKREAAPAAPVESQTAQVQRSFDERLSRLGVTLSSREYEVCLAHLLGNTLPAIARQLSVRESTAATYFRRAGIKLNLSGRHGFAKWMLGTA